MTAGALSFCNISVTTTHGQKPQRLVDDVSLVLNRGEVLALVGESGSGKSLTCAAGLGTLPPGTLMSSGSMRLGSEVLPPEQLRGRLVASIMQNPRSAFNPVRTMQAHAFETLRAMNVPKSQWPECLAAAMQSAGLDASESTLKLHPFEMSGGMLQRMMIALALLGNAPFLIADEPTTDLDLVLQRDILNLLDRMRTDYGLGLLLITHDLAVVARLADRVAIMDKGKIVETGSTHDIFCQPFHPVTRRLLRAHLTLYGLECAF
ncbi:ATP-binding cassette domain-containing protein [Aureimonas fodinaquatilis]|uniref:ATP-binding cassette domain-containing protein n=1 Tax=Aureimonas fodinaquatilis TaxID=2565783 RepID=A0A5B0E324_9HYPH|nr:ATP-binding cassette domain-containing protein [Aureimonas fodinaquatilis]KAA0972545.1 ATP-binding cassette domain-containing protein [Aureimonas fodinaquatilis]